MTGQQVVLILLASLAGGSSVVMIRLGVGEIPPLWLVTLRLSVATIAFAATLGLMRKRLPTDVRTWRHLIVVGLTNAVWPMTAFTSALQHVSSTVATVFIALIPLMTGLLAHVALEHERLNRTRLAGLVIAFAGVAIIVLTRTTGVGGPQSTPNWLDYLLLLSSALAVAITSVYVRRYLAETDVWTLTAIQTAVGLIFVAGAAWLATPMDWAGVSWKGWLAVAYVGLMSSYLNFILFFFMVKRFGAVAATIPWYLMPLVSAVVGAWMLDEVVTISLVGGAGLILLGVGFAGRNPPYVH